MMLWKGLILMLKNNRYIVGEDFADGIKNPKSFSNFNDAWKYMVSYKKGGK